jgi:predicted nucleotidyltransferase
MFSRINNDLDIFFEDTSREVSVREYARMKKMAPATASKLLKNYKKESILKMSEDKGYLIFRLNKESFVSRKLSLIYWSLKLDDFLKDLEKFYGYPTVILFGSIEKCENLSDSDIDLVILSEKRGEFPSLGKFEKKYGREIQLFNFKSPKDISNKNLLNNVLNGSVLMGEIRWT